MSEFPELPEPPEPAPEAPVELPAEAVEPPPESAAEQPVDVVPESDPEPESWDPPEIEPTEYGAQWETAQASETSGNWWESGGETSAEFNVAAAPETQPEVAETTGSGSGDGGAPPDNLTDAFNEAAAAELLPETVDTTGTGGAPETVTDAFNEAAAKPPEQPDPPPEANHERSDWLPPPTLRGPAP